MRLVSKSATSLFGTSKAPIDASEKKNTIDDSDESFERFLLDRNLRLYKISPGSTVYNALADQIYLKEELGERVWHECLSHWVNYLSDLIGNPQIYFPSNSS